MNIPRLFNIWTICFYFSKNHLRLAITLGFIAVIVRWVLTVGVLGQYVGILFDEVKGRPEYIIDETRNMDEPVQ